MPFPTHFIAHTLFYINIFIGGSAYLLPKASKPYGFPQAHNIVNKVGFTAHIRPGAAIELHTAGKGYDGDDSELARLK